MVAKNKDQKRLKPAERYFIVENNDWDDFDTKEEALASISESWAPRDGDPELYCFVGRVFRIVPAGFELVEIEEE